MDDEAKQLLREMRDLLRETSARDAAWIEESRRNMRRLRRLVRFVLLPMVLVALALLLWTFFSPPASPRSPIQKPGPVQTVSLPATAGIWYLARVLDRVEAAEKLAEKTRPGGRKGDEESESIFIS
jgi:hypothetical protein